MSLEINLSGTWKSLTPSVNLSGTWKPLSNAYVNVGGSWELFFTAISITLSPTLVSYNSTTGEYQYSVSASVSGGTPTAYSWSIASGTVLTGQGTDTATFQTTESSAEVTCVVTVSGNNYSQSTPL